MQMDYVLFADRFPRKTSSGKALRFTRKTAPPAA